jgi:hypothetical protein
MNINDLKTKLQDEGFNRSYYSIEGQGAPHFDGLVLKHDGDKWTISFSEHGHHNLLITFTSETDACQHFYKMISEDDAYKLQNVDTFDSEAERQNKLAMYQSAGIKYRTDDYQNGDGERKYRIFVHGSDVKKVRKIRGW